MELRECPFCGGEVLAVFVNSGGFYVVCYGCNTCGPEKPLQPEAIDAWNRRVGDDLMERMEDDGK